MASPAPEASSVYQNGRLVPFDEAKIHVLTPAVKFGASVFEGLRAYWNPEREQLYVFRLADHARRLAASILLMGMDASGEPESLMGPVGETLRANGFCLDVYIRQMALIEGTGEVASTGPVGMVVAAWPRGRIAGAELGLRCSLSSWTRIADPIMPPRIKCAANYQNSRLAMLQARADGYDVTLLTNSRGKVAEAPGACVCVIRDGVLITPSLTSDILDSITRRTLLELARTELGLLIEEREVDRTAVYAADEVFLCGTGWEVSPIIQVDRFPIGGGAIGPLTVALRDLYFEVVRGRRDKWLHWCHGVYPARARGRG